MLYEITIPQHIKMLKNLSAILDKSAQYAEAKKFEMEVLLQARLAPDQFNLVKQIQITCDTAKLCAARLTGIDAPVHPDTEKSLPELRARIASVVSFLETLTAKDFLESEGRRISQPRWEGKYLTGEEFAFQHAIPNFYFHMATAYSILRHNGVDVGKKDYLGKMPFKS
ncbi:MAG: DUF1993 domain-containing protein [Pseudomonadota bacterium]|nr:DUF1993 domain-containing protein [Pseudomonadota bacterium]